MYWFRQEYIRVRIFGKKKKAETAEITLLKLDESGRHWFWTAIARALLLFLLLYGALGGFLSAFEIEYNNGLCMAVLFGIALLLSSIYETGKRWLINLVSLLLFAVYLYIAVSGYWVINSGYYAILNEIYEEARDYLSVDSGLEYSLAVEENYTTVTMFILFLGMVGVILFNIILQNKCSLFRAVILTLTPYVIPFYFDRSPKLIYILFLLTAYLAVAILQGSDMRSGSSRLLCYILPMATVLAVVVVRAASLIVPQARYESITPKNALKEASETGAARFAQYGMAALFGQGSAGAGISGGRLNKNAVIMPSYETVLKVRYTPYDYAPVYLKAFTGKDYLGDLWMPADDMLPDDAAMLADVAGRAKRYQDTADDMSGGNAGPSAQPDAETETAQGRGVMEVEIVRQETDRNTGDLYEYRPYYTDPDLSGSQDGVFSYVYYPDVSPAEVEEQEVSDAYLEVPARCRSAVEQVCAEAGFHGTPEEIAQQIVQYFQEEYSYTLRPGYAFGNPDYISHFLLESRRGYCMHFASAATMLFREMGIRARYAEGYAFSYFNLVENGELVEGAAYSDYYDGYSPLGETALVELEIPDAYAHAWVEIYIDGRGWIVVDPTPAQTEQEETTSFWDAFMDQDGGNAAAQIGESDLGTYLEGTLGGAAYVLSAAAVLLVLYMLAKYLLRMYRESRLSERERVKIEYAKIQACLGRRSEEYAKLRTIQEQLEWMKRHNCSVVGSAEEQALYEAYFADQVHYDCRQLRRSLHRLRLCLAIYHRMY